LIAIGKILLVGVGRIFACGILTDQVLRILVVSEGCSIRIR